MLLHFMELGVPQAQVWESSRFAGTLAGAPASSAGFVRRIKVRTMLTLCVTEKLKEIMYATLLPELLTLRFAQSKGFISLRPCSSTISSSCLLAGASPAPQLCSRLRDSQAVSARPGTLFHPPPALLCLTPSSLSSLCSSITFPSNMFCFLLYFGYVSLQLKRSSMRIKIIICCNSCFIVLPRSWLVPVRRSESVYRIYEGISLQVHCCGQSSVTLFLLSSVSCYPTDSYPTYAAIYVKIGGRGGHLL